MALALRGARDAPIPMGRLQALGSCFGFFPSTSASPSISQPTFLDESCTLALRPRPWACWSARRRLAGRRSPGGDDALLRAVIAPALSLAFARTGRHIVDSLTEVVLDALDQDERQTLLESSVLDTMCLPLFDAAAGGRRLRRGRWSMLRRREPFPDTAQQPQEVYGYHELFADMLRNRCSRVDPELALTVHGGRPSGRVGGPPVRGRASRRRGQRARQRDHVVLEGWRPPSSKTTPRRSSASSRSFPRRTSSEMRGFQSSRHGP